MKSYELMVVFRAEYPAGDESALKAFILKLTGASEIVSLSVIGKKRLSYPIKKMGLPGMQSDGVYVLAKLSGSCIKADAIEKEVRVGTDVLRYLLIARRER